MNLIASYPDLTKSLHEELLEWSNELVPPGLPTGEKQREQGWYEFYFTDR